MAGAFGRPKDDDEIVIDGLGDVDENPWYMEPGDYVARCTLVDNKPSSAGNPMLTFTFTIESAGPAKGKDIKDRAVLTEGSKWKLKQILGALGFDTKGKSLKFKPKEAIGRKCMIKVADGEYNGEKTSNIKKCSPLVAAA